MYREETDTEKLHDQGECAVQHKIIKMSKINLFAAKVEKVEVHLTVL